MTKQVKGYRTPSGNPNVGGKNQWAGWCHAAVREGFGIPRKDGYGSATDAWNKAKRKHATRALPVGVAAPIFFSLDYVPAGHVAVVLSNGEIETTGLNSTFKRFKSLEALEAAWPALQYLGWTEDINAEDVILDYTPEPAPSPDGYYTVVKGDTLSSIAKKYGLHWTNLYEYNKAAIGSNPNVIHAGLKLWIPGSTEIIYVVKKGQTLSSIAESFGTTWQVIYAKNKAAIGSNPSLIHAGLKLKI